MLPWRTSDGGVTIRKFVALRPGPKEMYRDYTCRSGREDVGSIYGVVRPCFDLL